MINFYTEHVLLPDIDKCRISTWIENVAFKEGKTCGEINYIFCNDQKILEVNKDYLNHDYFTDIITFNYNDDRIVSGDLFISVDTVKTNAETYKVTFEQELYRVMIHGVLHLIGFDDVTEELQLEMTQKEDEALNILYTQFL